MSGRIAILARLDTAIAGGGRAERLARVLGDAGYEVAVVALSRGDLPEEEDRGAFRLLRPRPDAESAPPGPLAHLDADPELGPAAARLEPDLVVATDPTTLRQAVAVARETGARVLYDSWELYPDQVEQTVPRRWFRPLLVPLLRRQVAGEERRCLPAVSALVFTSEGHRDGFLRRHGGLAPGVVAVVRNCPPFETPVPDAYLREATGAGPEDRVLVYAGVFGTSRGLLPMLDAAARLGEGVRLAVMGWGWLEAELRARAPSNATILPPVPAERLVSVLAGADAGLLPIEPKNESKRHALANKLFEYLMAGLPVVATDLPGHRAVLAGTGAGVLVPRATAAAIADGVERVFREEAERPGAFREAALRLARERYSLESETPALLDAVKRAITGRRPGSRGSRRG